MEAEAEAERMGALKRAYAEVILNTAKESAARILSSERKALRFQQSMFAAKEEALAAMLRLKSLMDSKIKEAELTSLGQVKIIQELEVKLKEAEYTIGSLREELEKANNELKKRKNNIIEPLNGQNPNGQAISDNGKCQESQLNSDSNVHPLVGSGSLSTGTISGQKMKGDVCSFTGNATVAESLKHFPEEKECASNPDLASIIMRSKEPELYRNGYTQRIRAFEHNVLAGKVPNEQNDGQQIDSTNESNPSGKLERPHTIDSIHTVKTVAPQAKNSSKSERHTQPSSNCENGHPVKIFRNQSLRKPRTRYIYVKPTDCATSSNQDARCHQQSGFEGSKMKSGSILTTKSITEEPAHKLLKSHSAPTVSTSCEGAEDKRFSLNSVSCTEIPGLLPCNNRTLTNPIDMKQNLNCQNEIPQSSSYNMETNERENSIKGLMLLSTTEMKDDILLAETKQNEEVRPLQIDDSKLTSSDQNIAENLDVMKDDPVIQSNFKVEATCESSEALPQVGKDKFLKYTFQRTRKRGASSSKNESASVFPEKVTGKRKSTDKENVSLEPHKPPSVTELPRNNRRLMQVARQLISLSEKRW